MSAESPESRSQLSGLLRASANGDRDAFAALYRSTSAKLFGLCLGMLRAQGEAEDALQGTYIAAWRHAGSFDPDRATAMTWLIALARNQCIDRLRQRHGLPLDDEATAQLVDPAPDPPMRVEASQQRQRLERCLEALGQDQQSAVRAAFFSGVTYNELAVRRGVPLATMKSWIRRSLIRLRNCLEHSS